MRRLEDKFTTISDVLLTSFQNRDESFWVSSHLVKLVEHFAVNGLHKALG